MTAAVHEAQAFFPPSPPSTPKAYCVMPVDITKCSQILLIVPILLIVVVAFAALSFWTSRFLCFPCDSCNPTCFSLVTYLSFCLVVTFLMSFCWLISDVATVDFLLLNLLPTSWSIFFFCILDCFLKDFELLRPHSKQSPVVNHRAGLDFWYLPIHSIHPQARDTCNRDQTETASLDDSIHCLLHFTTRPSLAKESFQMEHKAGL